MNSKTIHTYIYLVQPDTTKTKSHELETIHTNHMNSKTIHTYMYLVQSDTTKTKSHELENNPYIYVLGTTKYNEIT
jgi:hypothetical protein